MHWHDIHVLMLKYSALESYSKMGNLSKNMCADKCISTFTLNIHMLIPTEFHVQNFLMNEYFILAIENDVSPISTCLWLKKVLYQP